MRERGKRTTVVGVVTSDRMQKTITVREEHLVRHYKYGKYVRRAATYKAHDEGNEAKRGDTVEIVQTRPLSKTKHWRLARIVRSGQVEAVIGEEERAALAARPKQRPQPAPAGAEATAPPATAPAAETEAGS